ncbi:hypothetical protein SteCoe_34234 [Stentor coeruleus]|uniref:Receptor ligand binding region domain-containing protein n=1 Tax=Stentor coeruleus TaxID=5963 RepID=A0A1R2AV69_9CILI|nr:hypothetical protein SteCoe_34234 [Stentor coeruleus]
MAFLLLQILIASSSALNIQIIVSDKTIDNELSQLESSVASLGHEVSIVDVSSLQVIQPSIASNVNMAIDYTQSPFYSFEISEYSKTWGIIILKNNCEEFTPETWTFCVHPTLSEYASALYSVVQYLDWKKVVIISDTSSQSLKLGLEIEIICDIMFHSFLSIDSDQEIFDDFVGKKIKAGGYKQVLVFGNSDFMNKVSQSFYNKLVYQTSGIIAVGKDISVTSNEKTLLFFEKGLENTLSDLAYTINALTLFINLAEEYTVKFKDFTNYFLMKFLEENTRNHMKLAEFSLVNIISGEKVFIGNCVPGFANFTQYPVFPSGNPNNNNPIIGVSISFNNPIGFPSATQGAYMQLGAVFAATYVNITKTFLKNHDLAVFYASCGSEFFFHDLSYYCWSSSSYFLGSFYVASPVIDVILGENQVFNELGVKIPMIGGLVVNEGLTNKTKYPMFTRVVASDSNLAYLINLFNVLGWHKFNFLYTNNTLGLQSMESVLKLGLTVLNKKDLRAVPEGYNSSQFETYKEVFLEIERTKVRPLFLMADFPDIFYIAESLYDIGLRSGDIIAFFVYRVSANINMLTDTILKKKVVEILEGNLIAFAQEWVGDYGKEVKNMIIDAFGLPYDYKCFSYDAMMLGINAVDFLLVSGNMYEDPDKVNQAIRMQRFTGCSGIVSIDSESNDRKGFKFGAYQVTFDNDTGLFYDKLFCDVNQDSLTPLIFVDNFTWPNGQTDVPSDSRLDGLECPFEDREKVVNKKATIIFYVISLFFMIYTTMLSLFFWKKWWNNDIKPLVQSSEIKFGDYVVMIVTVVDLLQIIGMGPDLTPFLFGASKIPDFISVNMSNIINFTKDIYWMGVYVTLITCLVWFYLSIVVIFRLDEKLKYSMFKFSNNLAVSFMPIIGDLLFLPIVSILLFIFDCHEGTGTSITESFLTKDCSTYCWKGHHLIYSILSIFTLLIFLPLSIFLRPVWQELVVEMNIKTNSIFHITKGILQVLLVILNRTVKKVHQSAHGIAIVLLLIVYSLFLSRCKPFNYPRLNMWKQLSITAACWSLLIASGYWLVLIYPYMWLCLFAFGWVIIGGIGIFLQRRKFPSLLFSQKSLDISALVKFTFTNTVKLESLPIHRMSTVNFATGIKYQVDKNESNESNLFKRIAARLGTK